jgi:hypothetical protein
MKQWSVNSGLTYGRMPNPSLRGRGWSGSEGTA